MGEMYRQTNQRKVIYEELKKLKTHPTADELYLIVRKKIPNISIGTVYRNLELLAEIGQIKKIELRGKTKRFDANLEKHLHLRCVVCDKIEDLMDVSVEKIEEMLSKEIDLNSNFKITEFNIDILGVCEECQKNKAKGGVSWLKN